VRYDVQPRLTALARRQARPSGAVADRRIAVCVRSNQMLLNSQSVQEHATRIELQREGDAGPLPRPARRADAPFTLVEACA
jgi:hypothetical protein